jgi:hypothetical protein
MRRLILAILLASAGSAAANAATIVIMTDPMTLERQTYVLKSKGPHRVFMCMAPPATSGCTEVPIKILRR